MPRFERSREKKSRNPRSPRRESRGRTFKDREDSDRGPKFRDRGSSDRGPKRSSRGRRDFEMTEVICSSCGDKCEVPFKPTSNKPVYCSDCFSKQESGSSRHSGRSSGFSEKDLDIINEKLNKIMKALKIE